MEFSEADAKRIRWALACELPHGVRALFAVQLPLLSPSFCCSSPHVLSSCAVAPSHHFPHFDDTKLTTSPLFLLLPPSSSHPRSFRASGL
eukprot:2796841-Rhodomonas_salina.1